MPQAVKVRGPICQKKRKEKRKTPFPPVEKGFDVPGSGSGGIEHAPAGNVSMLVLQTQILMQMQMGHSE